MLSGFETLCKLTLLLEIFTLQLHTSLSFMSVYASLSSMTCRCLFFGDRILSLCFHSTLNSFPNIPLPHSPELCSTYHTILSVLNIF